MFFAYPDVSAVYAQGKGSAQQESEAAYNRIRAMYKSDYFEKVLTEVDAYREAFPKSNRESSITYIAAQAAFKLRDLERARSESLRLILKFSDSRYADDVRLILAYCELMSEHWAKAGEYLDLIEKTSGDTGLVRKAVSLREELAEFQSLQENIEYIRSAEPKIGLILPITGFQEDFARAYLQGFRTRWIMDERPEELVIYDSEGDPIRAVRLAQKQFYDDGVWAVSGGLNSQESAALAAISQAENIPFVTTACGTGGLSAIGRNVFQGRPDFATIGRKLGQHAMHEMDMATFAILAPLNQEGFQLVRGFKEAVEIAGGEVIAEEAYYPGARDFATQFKQIRAVGLRRAFDDSLRLVYSQKNQLVIDGIKVKPKGSYLEPILPPFGIPLTEDEDTTWTLSELFLDSLWNAEHERLREWMSITKKEIDSLEIPLKTYTGFLLITEPGAIEMMAPQFARFNITAQLFCNEQWADREALYRVRNYVNGIVFAEPLAAKEDAEYMRFSRQLSNIDSTMLNKHHLAGERAAKMLEFALEKSEAPDSLRKNLSMIRDLKTLSGEVSLVKEERVDRNVTLVQFTDGNFKVLTK